MVAVTGRVPDRARRLQGFVGRVPPPKSRGFRLRGQRAELQGAGTGQYTGLGKASGPGEQKAQPGGRSAGVRPWGDWREGRLE